MPTSTDVPELQELDVDELVAELDEAVRDAALQARWHAAQRILVHCTVEERWQLLELVVWGSPAIDAAIAEARFVSPDTDEAPTAMAAVEGCAGYAPAPAAAKRRPARARDWAWWQTD